MNCPKCGDEMVLSVSVRLRLPARYVNQLTKGVIRRKECQVVAADWEKASMWCAKCHHREKGL